MNDAARSKPRPMPDCTVLPPGELNGVILIPFADLSWKFDNDKSNSFPVVKQS